MLTTLASLVLTIHWNINPEIFKIGSIEPRWYGVLFASSFIIGYVILEQIFNWENKNLKNLDKLIIYIVIATVIGARLGHCFFYDPSYYLANPIKILKVWEGGLASHGAALGILFAMWLFISKHQEYTYLWIIDRIVIGVALSGLFIRTGNFFNSEIVGSPSTMPWAVVFERVDMIARHPVQLYEAFAYGAIFVLLFFYYKSKKENTPEGLLTGLFMVLVFTARLILEQWKVPQAEFLLPMGIKMGQVLSVPFIITGLILIIRALKKNTLNEFKTKEIEND